MTQTEPTQTPATHPALAGTLTPSGMSIVPTSAAEQPTDVDSARSVRPRDPRRRARGIAIVATVVAAAVAVILAAVGGQLLQAPAAQAVGATDGILEYELTIKPLDGVAQPTDDTETEETPEAKPSKPSAKIESTAEPSKPSTPAAPKAPVAPPVPAKTLKSKPLKGW